jgi:ribosomal protein S6--L-glutamate ligase
LTFATLGVTHKLHHIKDEENLTKLSFTTSGSGMILSFHPIIEAHRNIICAGRPPDEGDLRAIRQADAVILPQGCSETLYRMACKNCPRVFPNLDIRFDYPGKGGQIRLFRRLGIAHPMTRTYAELDAFRRDAAPVDYPAVVKLDWGGQGETVFRVDDPGDLDAALRRVAAYETSGQKGFLIQQYIPCGQRSLRVAVIGSRMMSYWRSQPAAERFGTSVAGGAVIDPHADPELQAAGREVVLDFCRRTGLQLAGFDFIFYEKDHRDGPREPLMLEINYFFGRTGLGGSDGYYNLFEEEVDKWLATAGMDRTT